MTRQHARIDSLILEHQVLLTLNVPYFSATFSFCILKSHNTSNCPHSHPIEPDSPPRKKSSCITFTIFSCVQVDIPGCLFHSIMPQSSLPTYPPPSLNVYCAATWGPNLRKLENQILKPFGPQRPLAYRPVTFPKNQYLSTTVPKPQVRNNVFFCSHVPFSHKSKTYGSGTG